MNLDIRKGIARVAASGSLNGQAGSGSWKLGILCSGRWTAQKRGPVQAARAKARNFLNLALNSGAVSLVLLRSGEEQRT